MAHSLEVRVPLLDHVFVEHVATIPASMKLRRGEGKYIFKRALQGIVPDEVLTRKKMGFGVPLDRWFRGELRAPFESRVLARESWSSSFLEPAAIRHLWDQHQRGARDHSYGLWALLVLEHWGRRFGGAAR
jgi:asparagine synthase (glutamine-hydrolysing)